MWFIKIELSKDRFKIKVCLVLMLYFGGINRIKSREIHKKGITPFYTQKTFIFDSLKKFNIIVYVYLFMDKWYNNNIDKKRI